MGDGPGELCWGGCDSGDGAGEREGETGRMFCMGSAS